MSKFSCIDWKEKIVEGRSLLPEGIREALSPEADRAIKIFNNLHIPDVVGTPKLKGNCGEWLYDLTSAVAGTVTNGVRWCNEFFVLVPKKNNKALKLDTEVATIEGFKTISEIRVGDIVFGVDGKPVNVIGKSEIFTGRKCFEVEFSTGEVIVCDAQHLWVTDAHKDRDKQKTKYVDNRKNPQPSVKTTQEIADSLHVKSGKYHLNNHRLPIPEPVEYFEKDLPVHPYVLGYWIGNGTSKDTSLTIHSSDAEEILSYIKETEQPAYITRYEKHAKTAYISLSKNNESEQACGLINKFRELNVLSNKHIPSIYLHTSIDQRLELLRGLLDSDGHITKHKWPAVVFVTVLPDVAKSVQQLANSLGMKTTVIKNESWFNGKQYKDNYSIKIYNSRYPLFKLKRKLEKQVFEKQLIEQRSKYRQIVDVREVDSVPTQCITVDASDGQFLITRNYIPTHNTGGGSAVILTMLLLNKRPNAELLLVSPSLEISNLAFNNLCGMIELDEELSIMFHIRRHVKTILFRPNGAFIKVKTASPGILTGSKPVLILIDEMHVLGEMHNADRVLGQIRGGMLANPEAALITITTQSERQPTGIFAQELKKARLVRDGKLDLAICPLIYELPEGLEWKDKRNWAFVNPNNGYSVDIDRLFETYKSAEADGDHEVARWASQHLNVEIGIGFTVDTWVGANFWPDRSDKDITLDYIIANSETIIIGIDGGGMNDLFGFCVLGRHIEDSRWMAWFHAWAHPVVFRQLAQEVTQRLKDFETDGDLTFSENVGEDMDELVSICLELHNSGLLTKIGVDQVGIGGILESLIDNGIPEDMIVAVPQGYRLNGAIKTVERKLADGSFVHDGSRLMNWCIGNARTELKGSAIYITKSASKNKIDPLIAMFNAVSILQLTPQRTVSVEDWIV